MKLGIIGSRTFNDYGLLCKTMSRFFLENVGTPVVTEVVSGGANGADYLGAKWARENGVPIVEYLPDWGAHGKAAGFIRNEEIVKHADMVLAFWTGESRGTENSINIAQRLKKDTIIIYF